MVITARRRTKRRMEWTGHEDIKDGLLPRSSSPSNSSHQATPRKPASASDYSLLQHQNQLPVSRFAQSWLFLPCPLPSSLTVPQETNTITMKLSTFLTILTHLTISVFAHTARPSADDERGTIPATSLANSNNINNLVERDCWYGAPYGCSDGYCWRTCGQTGEWCWLAANNGNGAWLTCSNAGQCAPGSVGGASCGKGDCGACGCSC